MSAVTEGSDGSLCESVFLSYNENLLNIGESYATNVAKPPVGNDYIITYKDSEGEKTNAVFTSQGVPELITPVDKQSLTIGQKTELTWTPQNLGSMSVEVHYTNTGGGSTYYRSDTVLDDGNYELDLGANAFNDAANGDAKITLIHGNSFDSMPGFGGANITVESRSERDCTFTGQTAKSTKAMQVEKGKQSKKAIEAACSIKCSTGESKFVMFEGKKIDCCLK